MSLMVKDNGGGGTFEPMPIGPQQAVCVFVEDIGTHEGSYQGKPTQKHQCVICWELAEKMTLGDNAGKPFIVSKFYTASLGEKATLRKDLENWRGKPFTKEELDGFDLEKLKGANCMVNIVEAQKADGSTYRKVAAIMPLYKGLAKINPVNTVPPEWIQRKREESIEWREQRQDNAILPADSEPNQDDLPF